MYIKSRSINCFEFLLDFLTSNEIREILNGCSKSSRSGDDESSRRNRYRTAGKVGLSLTANCFLLLLSAGAVAVTTVLRFRISGKPIRTFS